MQVVLAEMTQASLTAAPAAPPPPPAEPTTAVGSLSDGIKIIMATEVTDLNQEARTASTVEHAVEAGFAPQTLSLLGSCPVGEPLSADMDTMMDAVDGADRAPADISDMADGHQSSPVIAARRQSTLSGAYSCGAPPHPAGPEALGEEEEAVVESSSAALALPEGRLRVGAGEECAGPVADTACPHHDRPALIAIADAVVICSPTTPSHFVRCVTGTGRGWPQTESDTDAGAAAGVLVHDCPRSDGA